MSKPITVGETAALLKTKRDILIITHKNPDGDTLGSGYALWAALDALGIRAKVVNSGRIPPRYDFMTGPYLERADEAFEPQFILSVDTAALGLMGDTMRPLGERCDLGIDHHGTNDGYAALLLCEPDHASCCEIIAEVIDALGVQLTTYIATCLYTGVSTDTGCFRYSNTTAGSHLLAARLIGAGVDHATLNRLLFETKSRARAQLEQMAVASMEFALGGKAAFITVSRAMIAKAGCDPSDIEGITPIPRTIEGVDVGVTLREMANGNWKVSVRTVTADAAALCAQFGGGGHKRAAGFESSKSEAEVKRLVIAEAAKALKIEG